MYPARDRKFRRRLRSLLVLRAALRIQPDGRSSPRRGLDGTLREPHSLIVDSPTVTLRKTGGRVQWVWGNLATGSRKKFPCRGWGGMCTGDGDILGR